MKALRLTAVVGVGTLAIACWVGFSGDRARAARPAQPGEATLAFEPNVGQFDERVAFHARTMTADVWVTTRGELVLHGADAGFALRCDGAAPPPPLAELPLPGTVNRFHGNDPTQWHTGIPTWGRVRLPNVWPGIDFVIHGSPREVEYDFDVAPGADPGLIRVITEGAATERAPVAFQDRERVIAARTPAGGFRVGPYDPARWLIIDPTLTYSTTLGSDFGTGVAIGPMGSIFVSGVTTSANFLPVAALYPNLNGAEDAIVFKLDPAASTLVYATYLGGSGDDYATAIAVDDGGATYVTGYTDSPDFPVANPMMPYDAGYDGFVAKLSGSGAMLVFSSCFGGSGTDRPTKIALDGARNIYVSGVTGSPNFPIALAAQATFGGTNDAFVMRIAGATPPKIAYATYLGGTADDEANGLSVSSTGIATVGGYTDSADFPTTAPFQAPKGGYDLFVSQLNQNGALTHSARIGGSGDDFGEAVAVDPTGAVYAAALTASSDFPGAGTLLRGPNDTVVVKLSASIDGISWTNLLGGSGTDSVYDIAVSPAGELTVVGYTQSSDFPLVFPLQPMLDGPQDIYVATYLASGLGLELSTWLGGAGAEGANAVALAANGDIVITGGTTSVDFPAVHPLAMTPGTVFVSIISMDAGAPDAGSDGGLPDAGPIDSGVPDGGIIDGGARDGGARDSGTPDAGPSAERELTAGCGCTSAQAPALLLLTLSWSLRRARRAALRR